MSLDQSTILQMHLDRLKAGDLSARDELLTHANEALKRQARRMFKDYPKIGRWIEFEDVLQNACVRLWRSLATVTPATVREFYGLAALQMRRELRDLARHFSGPENFASHHDSVGAQSAPSGDTSPPLPDPGNTTLDPGKLAMWTDFHRAVEALDTPLLEVFDLLFYQELSHAEAAQRLEISESMLKRRWLEARRQLRKRLQWALPTDWNQAEPSSPPPIAPSPGPTTR